MVVRIELQALAHAEGLYEALQDERIYTFLDELPPKSVEAVRERTKRLLAGAPVESGETWLNWTVYEDDIVVGYTQATISRDGTANLAFVLSPSVWGRSIAHTACLLTLAELNEQSSVVELIADTNIENERSQALLERLGFHRTHIDGPDVFYKLTLKSTAK